MTKDCGQGMDTSALRYWSISARCLHLSLWQFDFFPAHPSGMWGCHVYGSWVVLLVLCLNDPDACCHGPDTISSIVRKAMLLCMVSQEPGILLIVLRWWLHLHCLRRLWIESLSPIWIYIDNWCDITRVLYIFTCLLLGLFWGSRFSYDIRTSVACCDDPAAGANVRSSLFAVTSLLQTKSTSLRAIDSQAIWDTIICEIAKFF